MEQVSKIYTRTEILKMNKALLANNEFMGIFASYGIDRETVVKFLVGLDIDETIVCPIHNEHWDVIGKITFFDFRRDPRKSLFKATCSGLMGFSKTIGSAITVCKDIIDMMLAFQHGIPFPVVVTDRQNPPHFLRSYSKVHFLSDSDAMIDVVYGQTFVYGIEDLFQWLKLEAKKPVEDRVELSEMKITEVLRELPDDNLSWTNPALVGEHLYWLTFNRSLVLCPDGKFRQSFDTRYGRKIVTDNDVLYFKVTPANISRRFSFEVESTPYVYNDLWKRIYRQCSFIEEDQAKLLAAYIMYQYIFPHVDHVVHLHLITTSQRQRDFLLALLAPFMPNSSSFSAKGTASICSLYDSHSFRYNTAPFIIMDDFNTLDFDRGLTLLVGKKMCPNPRPYAYKAFKASNKAFRTRLYSWSIGYMPAKELTLPFRSLYADILIPLWAVLKSTGSFGHDKDQGGVTDLKLMRSCIGKSRSIIRNMDKKDIPFAGHYEEDEQKELIENLSPDDLYSPDPDEPPVSALRQIESIEKPSSPE